MGIFYLLAMLPALIWGLSLYWDRRIVWWEALAGCAAGFAVAGLVHACVGFFMSMDKQTVSGQVFSERRSPAWTEYYEYPVYRTQTVGSGKSRTTIVVFDHWQPTAEFHPEQWFVTTTFGEWIADPQRYTNIQTTFKDSEHPQAGLRSNFLHHNSYLLTGDPNDYIINNKTNYVYPVVDTWTFENRLILAPTIYKFEDVPKDKPVFAWPEVHDHYCSERLLGTASATFTITAWDQLNACLGPSVKVNLIAIGFPADSDISIGHWQEAAFKGGKQNDLVLCYGGGPATKPTWAYVFGWTDKNIVKRNLETLLLSGELGDKLLPTISAEVANNYVVKDFKKDFAYVHIEPPAWSYFLLVFTMLGTQIALHVVFRNNNENKDSDDNKSYRRSILNTTDPWKHNAPTYQEAIAQQNDAQSKAAAIEHQQVLNNNALREKQPWDTLPLALRQREEQEVRDRNTVRLNKFYPAPTDSNYLDR